MTRMAIWQQQNLTVLKLNKKKKSLECIQTLIKRFSFGCRRWIWTTDLRVMSPTSYQAAPFCGIFLLSWVRYLFYYIYLRLSIEKYDKFFLKIIMQNTLLILKKWCYTVKYQIYILFKLSINNFKILKFWKSKKIRICFFRWAA